MKRKSLICAFNKCLKSKKMTDFRNRIDFRFQFSFSFFHFFHFFHLTILFRKFIDFQYYDRERRTEKIKKAWFNEAYESVIKCVEAYDLKFRNFANRFNEQIFKFTRLIVNLRLNEIQKMNILNYIRDLNEKCLFSNSENIVDVVNYIIQKNDDFASFVNKNWWRRFFKRHDEFFKRRRRSLAIFKKNAFDVKNLKNFYRKLKRVINNYDIQKIDMWNMNETEFRIKIKKSRMIITFDKKKKNYMTNSNNKNYCTIVKIVNVVKAVISSLLILKAFNVLLKWSQNDFDDRIQLNVFESNYSNDDLALKWLQHFINFIKSNKVDRHIFFIVNGFEFHITIQFYILIKISDIILFKLFAHFIHIIQFFNVEVFQLYKIAHSSVIKKTIRNENFKFNRFTFLATLQKIRAFVFIVKTLRNAWKRCNINSFNFEVILSSMKFTIITIIENSMIDATKFVIFFFDSIECFRRTFHDFDSHKRNIYVLKKHYVEHFNFNVSFRQMNQFIKSSKSLLHILKLTIRNFQNARKNIVKKIDRNNLSNYKVKISDIIIVSQCRKQYFERIKKKTAKTKKKVKRETAKTKKETAKVVEELINTQTKKSEKKKNIETKKKAKKKKTKKKKKKKEVVHRTSSFFFHCFLRTHLV